MRRLKCAGDGFCLMLHGILWMSVVRSAVQIDNCNNQQTITHLDPAEDTVVWSYSPQDCTENWHWVFQNKFPQTMGIVVDIHDLSLSGNDTFSIFDNIDIENSSPARWFTRLGLNTAPVLLPNNQAVFQIQASRKSSRQFHSSVNLSLSLHPLHDMPPRVQLVSGTNDIGNRYRYNCSLSINLPPIILCDKVRQCIEGEDEADCEYLQPECGDWIPYKSLCLRFVFSYVFIHKSNTLYDSVPLMAERSCEDTYHANLVPIPDEEDREFLKAVLNRSGFYSLVVGLRKVRTVSQRNRRLYRYMWQWGGREGPIAYKEQHIQRDGVDQDCAVFEILPIPQIKPTHCVDSDRADGYVCSKPNPLYTISKSNTTVTLTPASTALDSFSTKRCVDGSMIQTFLSCPSFAVDTNEKSTWATKGGNITQSNTSAVSQDEHSSLELPPFQCRYGEGIHYSLTCDGYEDCVDGSDEIECDHPRNEVFFDTLVMCRKPQIITKSLLCNGVTDCLDDSDEEECSSCNGPLAPMYMQTVCSQVGCVPSVYTSFLKTCPILIMVGETQLQDLRFAQVTLDGYGMSRLDPLTDPSVCPETHFQCPGGYCIPTFLLNNGEQDCLRGEDEMIPVMDLLCPGFYRCHRTLNCIHPRYVCDGIPHCPFRDDELFCDLKCPSECTCQGHAYKCKVMLDVYQHIQVRYLDLSGVDNLTLVDLDIMEYLHFINVSSCQLQNFLLKNLRHLRVLDLSNNFFANLSSVRLEKLPRLQYLDLSNNPLVQHVDSTFYAFLHTAGIMKLEVLVMINTSITYLYEGVFDILQELGSLDVRGNQIDRFDIHVFQGLTKLRKVRTDNAKLCCSLPSSSLSKCEAPVDELSSCDDLLRSDFLRVFLWVMSLLAISGNIGVFIYRLVPAPKSSRVQAFPVLVQNLCVADCLMGVYLMIIGVADVLNRGLYFTRDTEWRHSPACKVAGFLGLLSSEVSAIVLCLITADRILAICFPLHQNLRFTRKAAILACVVTWGVGVGIAATPLLPFTSHWEFYSQTGICLPLPITRRQFPGQTFAFSIFIVFNFLLFVIVGIGQLMIFRAIHMAATAVRSRSQRQQQDIARRLFVVAFSDFCCWFPIGVTGLLASGGVAIPGVVNVWAAVVVMPINSALNPFLYTLNAALDKWRNHQEEEKTRKMLQRLHGEIDKWPEDRVEDLVQYCLRKKLPGREITPNPKRDTTENKMADVDLQSAVQTESTSISSCPSRTENGKGELN